MGPHGFETRSQATKLPGRNLSSKHSNGAYWMSLTRWEDGAKTVAPVDLGDVASTLNSLNEPPSVADAIDVAREDAEANVPTLVTTPKWSGGVKRPRHERTHVAHMDRCSSCVARRGTDDSHRKSDSHNGSPRVECDCMPLSSRVQLASPGWIMSNTIEVDGQTTAAAITAKAASDTLMRIPLALLYAWGRSDAKTSLRHDQGVTLSLILRKVQARRQHRPHVERSPEESHATVGAMERANRTLGEVSRTLKHATETRVGGRLETDQLLICRMVRHCCWIFCRYQVGPDGGNPLRCFGMAVTEADCVSWGNRPDAHTWIETATWLA